MEPTPPWVVSELTSILGVVGPLHICPEFPNGPGKPWENFTDDSISVSKNLLEPTRGTSHSMTSQDSDLSQPRINDPVFLDPKAKVLLSLGLIVPILTTFRNHFGHKAWWLTPPVVFGCPLEDDRHVGVSA